MRPSYEQYHKRLILHEEHRPQARPKIATIAQAMRTPIRRLKAKSTMYAIASRSANELIPRATSSHFDCDEA